MDLLNKSSDTIFILIHGFGTSKFDLLPLAHSFYNEGYSCKLVKLKGHEETSWDFQNISLDIWINQVKEIYDLYKKSKKIYLIGFSLGGTISLEFINRYPQPIN